MTRVLVVKLSSLGDVIHCLPAITDAAEELDGVAFDWVVEEGFEAIPKGCGYVDRVIPIALRRWRKRLWSPEVWKEIAVFRKRLRNREYDLVIDAQGLVKSALVARMARGVTYGFDKNSAREAIASLFYRKRFSVARNQHAIERLRQLFGSALSYLYDRKAITYGLKHSTEVKEHRILLIHGTTWSSKEWPVENWIQLAELAVKEGYEPCLTWGNQAERERCELIISSEPKVCIIPRMKLQELISNIAAMGGVVTVDTGLGHLSAALDLPVVSIYGSTDPILTGIRGTNTSILSDQLLDCRPCRKKKCMYENDPDSSKIYPPCYETITPEKVWRKLVELMKSAPSP